MITIRTMIEADLAAVMTIDREGSPETWTASRFQAELDNSLSFTDVAEIDGSIAGFLCSWLVAGELEIHNIVTAPSCRRRGVAQALLDQIIERSLRKRCDRLLLEVRVGNSGAIALYRKNGFVGCGVRKGYYRDGEDALLMEMSV